jgi:hypothetical protein
MARAMRNVYILIGVNGQHAKKQNRIAGAEGRQTDKPRSV